MPDEIDELVKQLKEGNKSTKKAIKEEKKDSITDNNVNEYIFDKVGNLVNEGCMTIEALKEVVLAGGVDAKEITAFSELYRAVTGAVDVLNKINIQNKKHKAAKEIKQIDMQHKIENPTQNNTNVLIATREEIMERFIQGVNAEGVNADGEKKVILNAEYEEKEENE